MSTLVYKRTPLVSCNLPGCYARRPLRCTSNSKSAAHMEFHRITVLWNCPVEVTSSYPRLTGTAAVVSDRDRAICPIRPYLPQGWLYPARTTSRSCAGCRLAKGPGRF